MKKQNKKFGVRALHVFSGTRCIRDFSVRRGRWAQASLLGKSEGKPSHSTSELAPFGDPAFGLRDPRFRDIRGTWGYSNSPPSGTRNTYRALARTFYFCLLIFLASRAGAQNLKAQEYGDAAYRQLYWSEFGLKDYNHACVFAGLNTSDTLKELESDGSSTVEANFSDTTTDNGIYYGAYTLSNQDLGFEQRKAIVTTARQIVDAAISYTAWNAIDPKSGSDTFTGEIADIDNIRCDGVVEYCYEKNGLRVWTSSDYPKDWNIATATGCVAHNNMPGMVISSPDYELSPWAQRGAPDYSPNPKNTFMTRGSVIKLPVCQVYETRGKGYCDVSIKATDESGIHLIAVKVPGSTKWTFSPRQPQHPSGPSYTYTIRVSKPGLLYYYAQDNGGNKPKNAQSVYVSPANSSEVEKGAWGIYE